MKHFTQRTILSCQLIAIALLMVTGVLLTSCESSGRGGVKWDLPNFRGSFETGPPHLVGGACGMVTITEPGDYFILCNETGKPTHVQPFGQPNKQTPIRDIPNPTELQFPQPLPPQDGSGGNGMPNPQEASAPLNSADFWFDGQLYRMMLPPETPSDIVFSGTAEELLDEYGLLDLELAIAKRNSFILPLEFEYDDATGLLDVRIAMTTDLPLPDPFQFDMRYETHVIPSEFVDTPGFVYHRIVGDVDTVQAYLARAGAQEATLVTTFGDVTITIDGDVFHAPTHSLAP